MITSRRKQKIAQEVLFGMILGVTVGATLSVGRSFLLGNDSVFFAGTVLTLGSKGVLLAFFVVLLLDFLVVAGLRRLTERWR